MAISTYVYTITIDGKPSKEVYTALTDVSKTVNIPYQYMAKRFSSDTFRYINSSGAGIIIVRAQVIRQKKGSPNNGFKTRGNEE